MGWKSGHPATCWDPSLPGDRPPFAPLQEITITSCKFAHFAHNITYVIIIKKPLHTTKKSKTNSNSIISRKIDTRFPHNDVRHYYKEAFKGLPKPWPKVRRNVGRDGSHGSCWMGMAKGSIVYSRYYFGSSKASVFAFLTFYSKKRNNSTRRNKKLLLITMHLHLFCFHCVPMLQCPILVQKTPIISLITIHPFNDNNDNYVLDCSFQREKASLKSSKCLI